MANPRTFKNNLYGLLARAGKALSSPHRIEMLELLAQAERSVESLGSEMALPKANASQHLQVLKDAGLVLSRRDGHFIYYRLSDPAVFLLVHSLRSVAERRFDELQRLVTRHFRDRTEGNAITMDGLLKRMQSGNVLVLDTRPPHEFEAGHIAGALNMPVDEIARRLGELPANGEYVAYCRGPYCVYADRAVALLTRAGLSAVRLEQGFPEWRAAGNPVATAPPNA